MASRILGCTPALLSLAKLRFAFSLSRMVPPYRAATSFVRFGGSLLLAKNRSTKSHEIIRKIISLTKRFNNLSTCIDAWRAGDPTSRMSSSTTQKESLNRRAILGPANYWTKHEELIQRLLAVMDMSTTQTIFCFKIQRCQHLSRNN